MVQQVHVLPVTVECVSCDMSSSPHQLVSHSSPVVLLGQCSQCGGQTQVEHANSFSVFRLNFENTLFTCINESGKSHFFGQS